MTRQQGNGPAAEQPVERMCALAGVSRAAYYRHWRQSTPLREETALRDVVQRLALHNRRKNTVTAATFPLYRERRAITLCRKTRTATFERLGERCRCHLILYILFYIFYKTGDYRSQAHNPD